MLPPHIGPLCSVVAPGDPGAARRDLGNASRSQGTSRFLPGTRRPLLIQVPQEHRRSGRRCSGAPLGDLSNTKLATIIGITAGAAIGLAVLFFPKAWDRYMDALWK